jgi:predicted acylesterase/phospholipase RssA
MFRKRGAAFSGGGFWGNVSVGMLDRISEDPDFEPWDCLTGISTGGLIANILAMHSKEDFRKAVQMALDIYTPRVTGDIHRAWFMGKLAALWKPSLRKTRELAKLIDDLMDVEAIREGDYEVGVGVLNLKTLGYELITSEYSPYARAVEASASLPAFFEPVQLPEKGLCVDGGAVVGCDINSLIKMGCTEIDAFVTVPKEVAEKDMSGEKTLGVALRTFEGMVNGALWREIRQTQVYNRLAKVDPDCDKRYIELRVWAPDRIVGDAMEFDPKQAVELQAIGREAATKMLVG